MPVGVEAVEVLDRIESYTGAIANAASTYFMTRLPKGALTWDRAA
jgi:hypothetical protein